MRDSKHRPFGPLPLAHTSRTVVCVTANNASLPRLRLRKVEFDRAADAHFGADTPDAQVAKALGVDKAVLSLYRNDKRQPPSSFITTVLSTFPDATLERFFEYVDSEPVPS